MQDKARAKSHHGAMDAMLRTPNIVAGIPAAYLPGWQRKLSQSQLQLYAKEKFHE
jgi:hypothetical protein